MTHRKYLKDKKKIVVKVGTSLLTYENGKINLQRMEKLVRVLADLSNSGREVILVSSGAVAVGLRMLGLENKPDKLVKKQALAAIGQVGLIRLYQKFFDEYKLTVAQVLLTRDGIENSLRRKNARNTLNQLIEMGIIPVVNENDTVSTHEIEFGDVLIVRRRWFLKFQYGDPCGRILADDSDIGDIDPLHLCQLFGPRSGDDPF